MMSIYSVVPHDATSESCCVGVSFPEWEEPHVKEKLRGQEFRTVPTPTSSCPHSLALTPWPPPCSLLKLPSSGWGYIPQMAVPPNDAAGRRGWDMCVFCLLWKEAKGREGVSWVPGL